MLTFVNIMVNMRSEVNLSMAKKNCKKVKRPRVNWYEVLRASFNDEANQTFYLLLARHPQMSFNRLAYNALKVHYSTTKLERVRWLGESL